MQPKGVSLTMKILLLSCILSMVLAVTNAQQLDSNESSGSDSSEEYPQERSFILPLYPLLRRLLRHSKHAQPSVLL